MSKFTVIVSHPRTGTNALIDFMQESFGLYDLKDFFRPMNENDLRWLKIDELKEKFDFDTTIETHHEVVKDVISVFDHFANYQQKFVLKIFPGHMEKDTLIKVMKRPDVCCININRDVIDTEISHQKAEIRDDGTNKGYSYINNTDFIIDLNFDKLEERVKINKEFYKNLPKATIIDYNDICDWINNVDPSYLSNLLNLEIKEECKKIKRWKQDRQSHAFYKITNYEDLRIKMRENRDFRILLSPYFRKKTEIYLEESHPNAEISLSNNGMDGYFKVGVSQTITLASGYNWKDGGWKENSEKTYRGTNGSFFSRNALNLCAGYNPSTGNKSDSNSIQGRRTIEMDAVDRIFMQVGADNAYYEDNPKASILLDHTGIKINGEEAVTKKYVDQKIEEIKCLILKELKKN